MNQPAPQYSSTDDSCCPSTSSPTLFVQPGCGLGGIYTEANPLEQQMFYLFRTDTVFQVAGLFDVRFWVVDVPQAAQAHRPLWHASIALAALQTSQNASSTAGFAFAEDAMDGVTAFVMRHYHSAIRELIPISNDPTGAPPIFENQQVLLMTNILLLGLASMQGNQRDAAMFSRHSLNLFHAWRFWERQDDWKTSSQGAMLSVAPLTALLYRFQSQETIDRLQRPAWTITGLSQISKLPSATPFASANEAYREVQPLFSALTTVSQAQQLRPYTNLMLAEPDPCLAFRYACNAWVAKFDHLRESQSLEQNGSLEMTILALLRATVEHALFLGNDYTPLLPLHRHMVERSEAILGAVSHQSVNGSAPASPLNSPEFSKQQWCSIPSPSASPLPIGPRLGKPLPYSYGPTVLEPLVMVAINCADFSLRRRAIDIMRQWPRAEAIWSSVIMAAFAEALMANSDAIDGGFEVIENGLGKLQIRSEIDTRENWTGRAVLVSW